MLGEAKREWFKQIGWNSELYHWYREIEGYQRKLLLLRRKEPP